MNPAIYVSNLVKTYRVYGKPSDRLKGFFFKNVSHDIISALDNVTFSVNRAETFGIIGENGAGKSTLLKILSGVASPTSGHVEVQGRPLSIIELGVGFLPEFTGRENIFFYGDVLGFSRDFIRGKLDEIIAFSELGSFIDKPVRTYSSGMVMRLAFSIVSSFEPEILILDEVLAVGDIHFQRKSLNRILEFKKKGGTILFCSHDTYHTTMICDRVLWLRDGKAAEIGEADRVVAAYENYQFRKDDVMAAGPVAGVSPVIIRGVDVLNGQTFRTGSDITVVVATECMTDTPYNITVSLKLSDGRGVFTTGSHFRGSIGALRDGRTIRIVFHDVPLLGYGYYFHVRAFDETGLILFNEKTSLRINFEPEEGDEQILSKYICRIGNKWEVL